VPRGKRRDESVHLAVKRNVLNDLATVGLEGGTEVVDIDTAQGCHQPVGRARWYTAHDEVIAAMGAPTTDDVIALFELRKKIRDLVGIVLKVAVHGEDVVAGGVIESGGKRRGLTEVAAKLDDEHAAIYRGYLLEQAIGAVARAVVDEDQLEGVADMLHDGLEAIVERGDVIFFV